MKRFVAAAFTPTVLIVGLLALVVAHFRNTLALAQQNDAAMVGTAVYSVGPVEAEFHRDGASDRPRILVGADEAVTYTDASSAVVVDGTVYSFWDEDHGYAFDAVLRQVYSTITGPDWQVIQVTSVGPRGVEVDYSFVARPGGPDPAPHEVTLVIVHDHDSWLDPAASGMTFEGGLVTTALARPTPGVTLRPQWSVEVRAVPATGVRGALALAHTRVTLDPVTGVGQQWAGEFVTTYTLLDPQPNMITPVAAETTTTVRGG